MLNYKMTEDGRRYAIFKNKEDINHQKTEIRFRRGALQDRTGPLCQ